MKRLLHFVLLGLITTVVASCSKDEADGCDRYGLRLGRLFGQYVVLRRDVPVGNRNRFIARVERLLVLHRQFGQRTFQRGRYAVAAVPLYTG